MWRPLRKKIRQLHVLCSHNHVDEYSMWKIMVSQMAMTLINNLISRKCFPFFSFKRGKKTPNPSGQNVLFRNEENFLVKVLFPRDLCVFYPCNLLLPWKTQPLQFISPGVFKSDLPSFLPHISLLQELKTTLHLSSNTHLWLHKQIVDVAK